MAHVGSHLPTLLDALHHQLFDQNRKGQLHKLNQHPNRLGRINEQSQAVFGRNRIS